MKKNIVLHFLGTFLILFSSCKKNSDSQNSSNTLAASTQWMVNSSVYKGTPGAWAFDPNTNLGHLASTDSLGKNIVIIFFNEPNVSTKPSAGKYYFVNASGSNILTGLGVTKSQTCFMEQGPISTILNTSIGGTLTDTATVKYNSSNKLVITFSNISVTGGAKVSGILVE